MSLYVISASPVLKHGSERNINTYIATSHNNILAFSTKKCADYVKNKYAQNFYVNKANIRYLGEYGMCNNVPGIQVVQNVYCTLEGHKEVAEYIEVGLPQKHISKSH